MGRTYLRLALNMRTHSRSTIMRHPAEIAVLHASQLERTATDGVEGLASNAVDSVFDGDVARWCLAVDLRCRHERCKVTSLGDFGALEDRVC